MKPVIIIALAFVLLSSTIIPVMGAPYTREQVESVTKNTIKAANDNDAARKAQMEGNAYLNNMSVQDYYQAYYGNLDKFYEVYGDNTNDLADSLIQQGYELSEAGDHENAILKFEKALQITGDADVVADAHIGLSFVYNILENHHKTIYHLEEAIKNPSVHHSWELALADLYYGVEDYEKALEIIKKYPNEEDVPKFIGQIEKLLEEQKTIKKTDIVCGKGTIDVNGQCVVDTNYKPTSKTSSKGGGCLIATATYGSELSPQVQQLRELRDNTLLQTESGISFMSTFNDVYYSFSPIIADYERENPIFKEMVKVAITPMITSLSILNYVDMDSEAEVLSYGISLIVLNIGMYFAVPVIVIMRIRKIGLILSH